jgi:PAS domain S-box-containing protein
MGLRKKLFITLIIALVCIAVITFICFQFILGNNIADLETAATSNGIYNQVQTIIYAAILSIVIITAVFIVIVMVSIDKIVFSRITRLTKEITDMGSKMHSSSRLQVSGKNEISILKQKINDALDNLESSQETLSRSQELYSTLVEESNDGIVIIDKGLLKFANKKMTEITGYPHGELTERRFTDLISNEYKDFVIDDFQRRTTGDHLPDKYETTMLSKDGRKIFVEISLNAVELDKNQVVIAIIRDITMRKLVQEQLITTDRLASIGELAAGVAHELSNPLTSVIGYTQLILEQDVPESLKKDLEIVNSEARRAADVTKNLLMFARRYAPEKQLINVNELIEKVLELRSYEQKINNVKVIKELSGDIKQVIGDTSQLQQVFINIIINAEYSMIKAHHGGILKISTANINNFVRVAFTDDGIGIPAKDIPRIFDPFFTTKDLVRGTGLGLSICHGIITRHNGKIYAESESGRGATFIIELPVTHIKSVI